MHVNEDTPARGPRLHEILNQDGSFMDNRLRPSAQGYQPLFERGLYGVEAIQVREYKIGTELTYQLLQS